MSEVRLAINSQIFLRKQLSLCNGTDSWPLSQRKLNHKICQFHKPQGLINVFEK